MDDIEKIMITGAENNEQLLRKLRRDILLMAEHSAHVAVALSCVEILAALYSGVLNISPDALNDENRDLFFLSKGHGCMALYAVLAWKKFLDPAILETYGTNGSILAEHPLSGKVPGVEFASGTLGHGLAVAAGSAKASKLLKRENRVFALLGDGECDEGSVWEAAAAAGAHGLDNLTAIIDRNGLQACGACADITGGLSLRSAWESFGWNVKEADGHDLEALKKIFAAKPAGGKPRAVICDTVKGKGIPFMENNLEWHYRPVRGAEKEAALRSIGYA